MDGKWIYNDDEGRVWNKCDEEYDTREEAIAAGREEAKEYGWTDLFVARKEIAKPKISIDAYEILNNAALELNDRYGFCTELGECFLSSFSDTERSLLQEMLDKAMTEWLKSINYQSGLFICCEMERVPIGEEETK